ncbi:MAG: hypothetical protein KDD33_01495 [Bdellovibrionales bacterium]|nr:hypothetical protein [Bdellovibrionales bacterium]
MTPVFRPLKNQEGILTLDFLFAGLMVFAFSAILFSFAITFTVVEVVQYISFASARNYSLAHLNEAKQRERATEKYQQLAGDKRLTPLVESGWFTIGQPAIGNFNDEYPNSSEFGDSQNFIGVKIPFGAPILYKRLPILGSTGTDPEGFTANIVSYLARHPTFQECQDFANQRIQGITSLGYNAQGGVVVIMDNGC